jgi:CheY-like chemotaxis protein
MTPANDRPRLMIADDNPVIRSMLGMSLSGGFEVVGAAADSEEAIELARATQPDAAVVDVEMPKGGGLRAVRGILEVAPGTAIGRERGQLRPQRATLVEQLLGTVRMQPLLQLR